MAKKSFKKEGGFSTQMYQGNQKQPQTPAPPKTKKKVSSRGFVRHTLLVKPEHLDELREVSKLAKANMQDVLAAALEKYFSNNWPEERREPLRRQREKEEQAKQEEKKELLL